MLYAAAAVNLNIVDHLACVTNQPNVSTARSGDHPANSIQCPQWEKERQILKIKCENNKSFPDARTQYAQFYTGKAYASVVKPSTCNKSTQTDDKVHKQTTTLLNIKSKNNRKKTQDQGTQGKSN